MYDIPSNVLFLVKQKALLILIGLTISHISDLAYPNANRSNTLYIEYICEIHAYTLLEEGIYWCYSITNMCNYISMKSIKEDPTKP